MQLRFEMPTELECARLAMAIDTEGTIDIHTYQDRKTRPGKTYTGDRMAVLVANTDPRLPLWCKEAFGGCVLKCKYKSKEHHRRLFKWMVYANKAMFVLESCLPFLLLKRDQAELAIAWQKTKLRQYARGVPDLIRQKREVIHAEIKRLKHVDLEHFYEKPN